MDILSIKLINFTCYKDIQINLQGVKLAGLLGANGSGKSSFIEAIPWTLYGESGKGGKKDADNYVGRFGSSCSVSLDILFNNEVYQITRTWDKVARKGSLNVFRVNEIGIGEPLSAKKTDAQELLINLFRMDYKIFTASSMSLQGMSNSFASYSDAERKEILASLLELEAWESVNKQASDKIKELAKIELPSLKERIKDYEKELDAEPKYRQEYLNENNTLLSIKDTIFMGQLKINDLRTEIAKLNASEFTQKMYNEQLNLTHEHYLPRIAQANGFIISTKGKIVELNQRAYEQSVRTEELSAIKQNGEAELEQYQAYMTNKAAYETMSKLASQYYNLNSKLGIINKNISDWERTNISEIEYAKQELESLKESSGLLVEVPCSGYESCPLLINAKESYQKIPAQEALIADLMNGEPPAYVEEYYSDRADANQAIEALGYNLEEHANMEQSVNNYAYLETNHAEYEKALSEMQVVQHTYDLIFERREELNRQLLEKIQEQETLSMQYETELFGLKQQFESSSADSGSAKLLADELEYEERILEGLRREHDDHVMTIGALGKLIKDIETTKLFYETDQYRLAEIENEIYVYELIEKASNKKSGVPAVIMEQAIPQLESIANGILERIMNGRFYLRIETQVESKTKGTTQEVLKLFVYDRGEIRPYQTFSGAERTIIDLSLRVAISKFLSYRAGTEIKIFVIDEAFSSLDNTNLMMVMDAIFEVSKDFEKVLIITHDERLKDMLPQRIIFEGNPEGTIVTIER